MNCKIFFTLLLTLCLSGAAANVSAQGTAFFYQGHLNDNGNAATGSYDLRFALYDAPTNGNAISVPQTNLASAVGGGQFTATLDFGAVFKGTNYWLSVGVRTNGNTNAFTLLWPRQPLLPVPYAVFATGASNLLGTLTTTQLVGTLPSANVAGSYLGAVNFPNATNSFAGSFTGSFAGNGIALTNLNATTLLSGTLADARLTTNVPLRDRDQIFSGANVFTNSTNSFFGTFAGNGISLTNLNATTLLSGTLADARLTTNVPLRDHDQTFGGANAFTNPTNSFTGSFFGNGLVGWIPVSGTATQAVRDTGYLLLNSGLTTVTLPTSGALYVGDIVRVSGAGSGGWQIGQNAGQSIIGNFLNASNAAWYSASSGNVGYQALASSADGLKMVAASGGGTGGIYTSTDGGKSWVSQNASAFPVALASSADGTKLAAAVTNGNILVSANSGTNGTWLSSGAPVAAWTCVASSADGNKLVAGTGTGSIYTSADAGTNWTLRATSLGLVSAVASSADGTKLAAVVKGGKIYTSVNSGANWTQQSASATASWQAVASSSDGAKLAAAVNGGKIYTSVDAGTNWTIQNGSPTANWQSLAASRDGGRLAAVVRGGGIYLSANAGVIWVKQNVPNLNWLCLAGSDDGSKLAAGFNILSTTGGIYYWQASWQITTTTIGSGGALTGGQGSAVELQFIGNNQFMPVSSAGNLWAN